jgi:recombination associated protein RdgC
MFKNAMIYRLGPIVGLSALLTQALQAKVFQPCGQLEAQSGGWVPPREDGPLVHTVEGKCLIALCTEKKILPAQTITRLAKERAKELEEQQGFKPGKKQFKEIKEQLIDELLPAALTTRSTTRALLDPRNGWLIVDTASASKADDIFRILLRTVGNLPVATPRPIQSPARAMTTWLELDEAPADFTIDRDAELVAQGMSKGTVRYKNLTLEADDVRRHIAAGKICSKLAMTYGDRISFVLTDSLAIKSITPLDTFKEAGNAVGQIAGMNEMERFDADFILMAGTLDKLARAILEALGGEQPTELKGDVRSALHQLDTMAREDGTTMTIAHQGETILTFGDGPDQLYDQAVAIVREQQSASISRIQRHLRIGYNRAARLLEMMEQAGIVSAMQSNGTRTILKEVA